MANKSRPKKVLAPYRKYVAGQGFEHTRGFASPSIDKDEEVEHKLPEDKSIEIINTPQGQYYYRTSTDTVVHIRGPSRTKQIAQDDESIIQIETRSMRLPWEIQSKILHILKEEIDLRYLLVCKRWYFICLSFVYGHPHLSSRNFSKFVDTVISNRKKKFGEYVMELDLSTILQSGKNSYVSKLLRRCSSKLEKFTAPQTSFGYAPLISLKSCHQLKYLDLGLVSETVKLKELFVAIQNFKHLTHLSFPRSSINCDGFREFQWPANLQYLKLSGGITNEFLRGTQWPKTISTLEFSFCPQVDEIAVYTVLSQIGDVLQHLYFHYPMPSLNENSLDHVFRYSSHLISVQFMVDYTTKWAFSEHLLTELVYPRPLKTIYLDCSGSLGLASKIHPDDFTIALMESRLPCLKAISVSSKLGWDMKSDEVTDLVSVIEDQGGSIYLTY
ncbi:hypothetical protein HG535_0A04120 [Zygotorulaspora mrakii]|uniref:F-box domain-containing protein n=1 Tax=Zygotorulaspora mrakii TaxID=42260 RepID=A0A7H9AY20_ZYGMR|nr:uncharacterized protein HG535_0A04120 [Zygotorulaspora mrakii]QLG70472.1 hypothetical protein HG535_0A04120 [Zygotorulaspora mrakii]